MWSLSVGFHPHYCLLLDFFQQIQVHPQLVRVAIFIEAFYSRRWEFYFQWNHRLNPEGKVKGDLAHRDNLYGLVSLEDKVQFLGPHFFYMIQPGFW